MGRRHLHNLSRYRVGGSLKRGGGRLIIDQTTTGGLVDHRAFASSNTAFLLSGHSLTDLRSNTPAQVTVSYKNGPLRGGCIRYKDPTFACSRITAC